MASSLPCLILNVNYAQQWVIFFMGKMNKLVELFSSVSEGQTSPVSCSVYDKRRFPPAVWGQSAMSAWCCAAPVPGHLVSGSVCYLYLFDFIKVAPWYWALCGAVCPEYVFLVFIWCQGSKRMGSNNRCGRLSRSTTPLCRFEICKGFLVP